eukprot:TRINITY_DN1432_c0_g1_i2.p1 TRINITY_DN1432_c0_g1~~TRINITY_DN1432_c0_g1_i2.p1  ORF type:complete len:394 (+),score=55.50 TRINITY_DN1432_c0_g1_i2:145-1326(+)
MEKTGTGKGEKRLCNEQGLLDTKVQKRDEDQGPINGVTIPIDVKELNTEVKARVSSLQYSQTLGLNILDQAASIVSSPSSISNSVTHSQSLALQATSLEPVIPLPVWRPRGPNKPPLEVTHEVSVNILVQLITAAKISTHLPVKDCISLSVVSKGISKNIRPLISRHAVFNYQTTQIAPAQNNLLVFYKPHTLKINVWYSTGSQFWRSLQFDCFADVIKIVFGESFQSEETESCLLPLGLKRLSFQCNKFTAIDYPFMLTHLSLPKTFNQILKGLPNTLTYLKLGYCYNKPLKSLPLCLTHLTFKGLFNKPIPKGVLPDTLIWLSFGFRFNERIEVYPPNLLGVRFGQEFQQPLNNLPSTLLDLVLSSNYRGSVEHIPSDLIRNLSRFECFSW